MCTYQIINILNRNATTRNLVGKLTVWLNILSQRCFRVGPSVKTVNIHVYTYIFLNKYLFQNNVHIISTFPFLQCGVNFAWTRHSATFLNRWWGFFFVFQMPPPPPLEIIIVDLDTDTPSSIIKLVKSHAWKCINNGNLACINPHLFGYQRLK